jgi:hypothetical protein
MVCPTLPTEPAFSKIRNDSSGVAVDLSPLGLFDSEDENNTIFRNVGNFSPNVSVTFQKT